MLIEEKSLIEGGITSETRWNSLLPVKINIFIWRALRGRLPVRVALEDRGVDLDSVLCPICNEFQESLDLVGCKFAKEIWESVRKWWGIDINMENTINNVLNHPGGTSFSGSLKRIWQATNWATTYSILGHRNNLVFKKKSLSAEALFADIRVRACEWISRKSRKDFISWDCWIASPYLTST